MVVAKTSVAASASSFFMILFGCCLFVLIASSQEAGHSVAVLIETKRGRIAQSNFHGRTHRLLREHGLRSVFQTTYPVIDVESLITGKKSPQLDSIYHLEPGLVAVPGIMGAAENLADRGVV